MVTLTVTGGVQPYSYLWGAGDTNVYSGVYPGYLGAGIWDANNVIVTAEINITEPPALVPTLTSSTYPNGFNVSCYQCFNGNINTTVSGGAGAYTYAWSNNATTANLTTIGQALYSITVTDANNCTSNNSILITEPQRDDWTMNGNTGTNPATQFIGTSDSVDVVFKTNASEILRLKKNGKLNIAAFNGTTDRLIYTNSHGDVESFPITLPSPTNAVCNTNAYNYYSLLFQWDGITHVDLFNCWQRFGFGTTTPDDRIEVKGAIRVTNWLDPNDNDYIRISHDNGPSIVNHGAGNLSINADNGKSVNICTGTSGDVTLGGNNYLAPDAGKNVGIGTTNAQHKLEVAGDINATNFYRSGSLIGGLNSWQYLNSGSDLVYNNGKVGIGTGSSVPSYKLTVTHNDGNGGLALNRENSTAFKSQISFRQNDNEKWSLGIDKDEVGNNNFFIFGGNNPACRLLINQYGHVGIGTDEPGSFLLAVNGMIGARELKITAVDPFPDFVFENDYPLLPLEQLKNYISENKHLPNIPSAAEVKQNEGVDVGVMQVQLLQKIEELTLYVIQQQQEIHDLRNELLKIKN